MPYNITADTYPVKEKMGNDLDKKKLWLKYQKLRSYRLGR